MSMTASSPTLPKPVLTLIVLVTLAKMPFLDFSRSPPPLMTTGLRASLSPLKPGTTPIVNGSTTAQLAPMG